MEFERLRHNWVNLGRRDPMWAVLTQPGTEGGRWREEDFYATGVESVAWFRAWCQQHDIAIPRGNALDFGCGAGRLTLAMAPHFDTVTGVDISAPMLEFARVRNSYGERVRFVENTTPDLSQFADGSFTFVLTAIVLQHMRPEYSLAYLREFMRVLAPGGLLFFQIAITGSGQPDKAMPATDDLDEARMEIHCAEREDVIAALAQGGGKILIEEPDDWPGPAWLGMHAIVRKQMGTA